jgi:serine/threonine-protein kinase
MGQVYVARDGAADGPRKALKVLTRGADEVQRTLMEREAMAIERLSRAPRPGVVGFVARGTLDDGRPWLAMDLVTDATSLTGWLRATDPDPAARLAMIRTLAGILQEVHRAGIVHRDLKASNVLVAGEPAQPTLIDFGIARIDDLPDPRADEPLIGGLHTSAPEQIRGEPVDGRTDQYALGVLAYRLLAGRYPFHSKAPGEVLGKHLHSEVPPLDDTVAPDVRAAIERALAKDPADRFPDMAAFAAALTPARPSHADPASHAIPWGWILLGLLTVLAALYSLFAFA